MLFVFWSVIYVFVNFFFFILYFLEERVYTSCVHTIRTASFATEKSLFVTVTYRDFSVRVFSVFKKNNFNKNIIRHSELPNSIYRAMNRCGPRDFSASVQVVSRIISSLSLFDFRTSWDFRASPELKLIRLDVLHRNCLLSAFCRMLSIV